MSDLEECVSWLKHLSQVLSLRGKEIPEAAIAHLRRIPFLEADRDSWADQADQRVTDAVEFLERAERAESENARLKAEIEKVSNERFQSAVQETYLKEAIRAIELRVNGLNTQDALKDIKGICRAALNDQSI